jgi:hypothetical protein
MFKQTDNSIQLNIFSSSSHILKGISKDQYDDSNYWHNQFREQVLSRIDEDIFKPLFSENMGAPNAPISVMIGMMIIKEMFGFSDSQLYESCRFNILIRSALGLFNLNDILPVESTYYLLRKRIHDYYKKTGIDLMEKMFQRITKEQITEFNVSGRSIRMDSKLIGSNIASYSRYELIHETIALFCKSLNTKLVRTNLTINEQQLVNDLLKERGEKFSYRRTKEEVKQRMLELGLLTYKLLNLPGATKNKHYQTLLRVFQEQYKITEGEKIEIRPKEEIHADSVQSPHDTDCGYRNKNNDPVKGYSHNLTETCGNDELSLITSVQTEIANMPDCEFVKEALEKTKEVINDSVENTHADGAYNSETNQEHMKENEINFYLTGLQGAKGRYDLEFKENKLEVTDTQTGEIEIAKPVKNNKWRIGTAKPYKYFTQKEIDVCQLRKYISQLPEEIKNKRNNVEASIFQLCFHTRNNKTRYRGKYKQKLWALLRSLAINLIRIVNYVRRGLGYPLILGQTIIKSAGKMLKNCFFGKNIKSELLYMFIYNNCSLLCKNFMF